MSKIVFWQRIVSPHMAGLAQALAANGNSVTYVAHSLICNERAQQGWLVPDITGIQLRLIENEGDVTPLICRLAGAVHLMQGIRSDAFLNRARAELSTRGSRWGALMETVDERNAMSFVKRFVYSRALQRCETRPDFILAIGAAMPDWVANRGYPSEHIFPFTYFLGARFRTPGPTVQNSGGPVRIGFAGRLIPLKRVDLLIDSLAPLRERDFELVIIGGGPLAMRLERRAKERLGASRTSMVGQLSMEEVHVKMNSLDCLVLPSDYDGWGVVVSEALMSGVPAICSDGCGSASVVFASGVGGVFPKGDGKALSCLIKKVLDQGRLGAARRTKLANWARCLGAASGANYADAIINCVYDAGPRPVAPWSVCDQKSVGNNPPLR